MLETKNIANAHSPKPIISLITGQLKSILVHLVNLFSNILGNDFLSCFLRRQSLALLGMELGAGTKVRGGGYFYGGGLSTGVNCQINRNCYFDFTESIVFGDNVVVGHGVTFITAEHPIEGSSRRAGKARGREIAIESGVWIGANATILPGITVGRGAVVAAGAMVTKNIPANVLAAGIPARKIKDLSA